MRQLKNPHKVKEAMEELQIKDLFTKDYSDYFLLYEYAKNEFLIHENERNHYLFFVWKGTVKCFSYTITGKAQFITYLRSSESIGLVGTIWNEPTTCNIQAVEKCLCLVLPIFHLRSELLDDNRFLRYLLRQTTHTLSTSNRYLKVSHCTSTESKLSSIILNSQKDGICQLNLNSCAEVLNTTYRHILRILSKFCNDNILEKQGKKYIIRDESFLTLCAEDSYEYIINEHFTDVE